jgi:hypothetical protein
MLLAIVNCPSLIRKRAITAIIILATLTAAGHARAANVVEP